MKALSIQNLKKVYPDGTQALKGIDLEVEEGDFFAFLGENGAGKTTTISIITNLLNKTSGTVTVFGHDLDTQPNQVKNQIGVVPQEINLSIFEKCIDIVVWQAGYYGIDRKTAIERAEELFKTLGLWEKRDQKSQNLSGGMKRRLLIARALIHKPKLLILDEPTAGVDVGLRKGMWDYLKKLNKEGTTIILTTHYIEEAEELCNHVAMINKGEIVRTGTIKDMIKGLDSEDYFVDLATEVSQLPNLNGFTCSLVDQNTIQVTIAKNQTINDFIAELGKYDLIVSGMRQTENRLEKLFMETIR
jgi:ABC-2 type transport system ATP-binding protein